MNTTNHKPTISLDAPLMQLREDREAGMEGAKEEIEWVEWREKGRRSRGRRETLPRRGRGKDKAFGA